MTTEKTLIGQATDTEVAAWKEANPLGIFAVEKEGRIAYFNQPGFKHLDAYHAAANDEGKSVTDGWKDLANLLYVGGCKELITSPLYLGNVVRKIEEAMIGEQAKLVKL